LIGLAIAILVVLVLGFVAVQSGGFSFGGTETTIRMDVPKVTISP
jgi:ABC-type transporter Mla subunit MlaD